MIYAPPTEHPVFSTAARWALRVLAWLAFGVSAYMAWHALDQSSLYGCGAGSTSGCDEVLSSSWSKWLGIPVAVIGLACYATLAALSVLLGVDRAPASRWIKTAFVTLSIVAAGASLWFVGVQLLVLGKFCPYCLVTDLCGLALGGITLWFVAQWYLHTRSSRRTQVSGAGLMALRSALPGAASAGQRSTPTVAPPASCGPLVPHAIGGGVALLALLIGGQILVPAKTYRSFNTTLDQPIALDGTGATPTDSSIAAPAHAQSHVALRIPTESDTTDPGITSEQEDQSATTDPAASDDSASNESPPPPGAGPQPERIVEFLNGSMKLDIYQHAHIGSPEAPHVMVEMLSYDCSHCRKMHRTVKKGLARYGDQLAVIVIPVPMEMQCNPLVTAKEASHPGACTIARMALGVGTVRPDRFEKFHDWLMADPDTPPQESVVVSKAYHTVDPRRLSKLSSTKELEKKVADYINLYARLSKQAGSGNNFGLPVQILGNQIMTGAVEKESDVFDAWEKHLGVVRQ